MKHLIILAAVILGLGLFAHSASAYTPTQTEIEINDLQKVSIDYTSAVLRDQAGQPMPGVSVTGIVTTWITTGPCFTLAYVGAKTVQISSIAAGNLCSGFANVYLQLSNGQYIQDIVKVTVSGHALNEADGVVAAPSAR